MKFKVDKKFFDKVDNACFGVIIARGIDNTKKYDFIESIVWGTILGTDWQNVSTINQNPKRRPWDSTRMSLE